MNGKFNVSGGLGKKFFSQIEEFVKQDGYGLIEWSCLDWNMPSIRFYDQIGAVQEQGRKSLSAEELEEFHRLTKSIKSAQEQELARLTELSVKWVTCNLDPIETGKISYRR